MHVSRSCRAGGVVGVILVAALLTGMVFWVPTTTNRSNFRVSQSTSASSSVAPLPSPPPAGRKGGDVSQYRPAACAEKSWWFSDQVWEQGCTEECYAGMPTDGNIVLQSEGIRMWAKGDRRGENEAGGMVVVPRDETFGLACIQVPAPNNDVLVRAMEAILNPPDLLHNAIHHVKLLGCSSGNGAYEDMKMFDCDEHDPAHWCEAMLIGYERGGGPLVFPKGTALRLGPSTPYPFLVLELHVTPNLLPEHVFGDEGLVDLSGMRLFWDTPGSNTSCWSQKGSKEEGSGEEGKEGGEGEEDDSELPHRLPDTNASIFTETRDIVHLIADLESFSLPLDERNFTLSYNISGAFVRDNLHLPSFNRDVIPSCDDEEAINVFRAARFLPDELAVREMGTNASTALGLFPHAHAFGSQISFSVEWDKCVEPHAPHAIQREEYMLFTIFPYHGYNGSHRFFSFRDPETHKTRQVLFHETDMYRLHCSYNTMEAASHLAPSQTTVNYGSGYYDEMCTTVLVFAAHDIATQLLGDPHAWKRHGKSANNFVSEHYTTSSGKTCFKTNCS